MADAPGSVVGNKGVKLSTFLTMYGVQHKLCFDPIIRIMTPLLIRYVFDLHKIYFSYICLAME